MPLQLSKGRRLEIEQSAVGCGTVKRHKCRVPLTHDGPVQELRSMAAEPFLTVTEPGGAPRLAATRENGQLQLTLSGEQGSRHAIERAHAIVSGFRRDGRSHAVRPTKIRGG